MLYQLGHFIIFIFTVLINIFWMCIVNFQIYKKKTRYKVKFSNMFNFFSMNLKDISLKDHRLLHKLPYFGVHPPPPFETYFAMKIVILVKLYVTFATIYSLFIRNLQEWLYDNRFKWAELGIRSISQLFEIL